MRKSLPFDVGPVHFVGIGGIGMSGIAEVMLNLGYSVSGSDIKDNANAQRLAKRGAKIMIGHKAENIEGVGALVTSTAIKGGNPEVEAARAKGIPVVRRADMLAELIRLKWTVAIAGTHGKTTTTSMVAALLDGVGLDPTVINGGVINAYGSNAKLGEGEWMVVEADESDGTFTKLRSTVAIVTNIDPEHMDHYGSMEALRKGFDTFVENLPFYGFAVLCADHPEVQALASRIPDRRRITYGFNPQSDLWAVNVRSEAEGSTYDLVLRARGATDETRWVGLKLPMAGRHNVQNSLAAIAVARELGGSEEQIRAALSKFGGVKRRFTPVGDFGKVRIIDDYGHHPVEIAAVLRAARDVQGRDKRVIAVVQPHRYTRLRDLFEQFSTCFNDADHVIVAPVYAAGEQPIDGISHESLVKGLINHGHRSVQAIDGLPSLAKAVKAEIRSGDEMVVCLGAGDITAAAAALADELKAL
ncbi:MAG TPA: UDP-N-acetylmuramate--L-alanine ligase [Hyphomonadaceae bacterium]|jgi:UDP-N-acetylmuramate--alanine ligase|nr:UDP-N-acetylmuramate--L-alanine ligase [Hyphomonadaceae bacterium]